MWALSPAAEAEATAAPATYHRPPPGRGMPPTGVVPAQRRCLAGRGQLVRRSAPVLPLAEPGGRKMTSSPQAGQVAGSARNAKATAKASQTVRWSAMAEAIRKTAASQT